MDVVSSCPLRVASMVWQRRPGAWALTVVCKATFQLQPGEAELLEEQEAPVEEDAYWDGDRSRSLCSASDLVPFKKRADVVLVGRAYAPGGQAVRSLVARLVVGELDKSIEVWCDRIFWQDGRVLQGQPFATMPLRYERAAGGPGTWNPVGMRFDAPADERGAVRIPNLQPVGAVVARRGDAFGPVGFGPIAAGWPVRAGKVPRGVEEWSYQGWKGRAVAEGVDAGYFNAAPGDQQVEAIRGGERIVLENLHPELPRLVTRLPGVSPRAVMVSGGRAGEGVGLVGDTLWINTVRGVATVVWRGAVALSHPGEEGRVVVSMEGAGGREATVALVGGGSGEANAEGTVALEMGGEGAAGPWWVSKAGSVGETVVGAVEGRAALPFVEGKSPWSGFQGQAREERGEGAGERSAEEGTGTLMGALVPVREVLPFVAERRRAAEQPELPAMIGPLAKVEMGAAPAPAVGKEAAPAPAVMPEEEEPQEVELPLEDFPIERCASIAASSARRPAETAQILEENKLTSASWAASSQRWSEAIRDETARGRTVLLQAYDRAYVAQLEEERGPIQVEEYARLAVAAERGTLAMVLAEMTLPRVAMVRIERVWLGRIAAQPGFGKRVRDATRATRDVG